jgi:hypothetical protein
MVVPALETSLLQAQGAQTLLRKGHQGKEGSQDMCINLASFCLAGVMLQEQVAHKIIGFCLKQFLV